MTTPPSPLAAPARRARAAAAALLLLAAVGLVASGCAATRPVYVPRQQLPRRAVVLDFAASAKVRTTPKEVVGWWFGGYDALRNENVGIVLADEVHRALGSLAYLDLYSRLDLKYYTRARREALKTAFKDAAYTDAEFAAMADRVDPVAIGRHLGVDYVVTGEVRDAYLARNRTIEWTWSRVDMTIVVWDVRSGERVWSLEFDQERQLASPVRLAREFFARHLDDLDAALHGRQGTRADGRPVAAAASR